jgi:RND family efflux transporter MFP subunit
VRRYSGTVTASNTSDLSFAVAGTVQKVNVDKGSRVTKGQLLATLDSKPFALNVQAAQAELAAATAELNNQKGERDRKLSLFKRGWVAKAAYDKAVAAYEAAEGQLSLARTRLGLAERDMSKTRLVAPFDGVIALRDINPFVEVKIGQKVLQIDSEGALEVELSVSDAVIGRLSIGTPVTIEARTVKNCGCTGRITEIGSAAGAANAVPVTAAVFESPRELLPGMAVEASVILSDDRVTRGYLVPLVAIAPGTGETRGYVFKFDPEGGVVRRTPIKSDGSISGNLVSITDGVSAGDIVAAAGVSLLRDGQRVKLMGQ